MITPSVNLISYSKVFFIKETSSGLDGNQNRLQPNYKTEEHSNCKSQNSPWPKGPLHRSKHNTAHGQQDASYSHGDTQNNTKQQTTSS
jgi:hypothetical protein